MKCAFEVRVKTIEQQVHREAFIWRVPAAARDCFCSSQTITFLHRVHSPLGDVERATGRGRRTRHHLH